MSDSTKVFTADQDDERLDRFLTRMEPALSRAHVQKVIAEGQALVGGRVRKSNYKLQAGEEVIFHLPEAKPVFRTMPGWNCDISGVRKWEDLPEAARNYVQYVEEKIGCPIGYVSVGPERDSIIMR